MEIWRPVVGFPSHEVSSEGRVRRLAGAYNTPVNKICGQTLGTHGYLVVTIAYKTQYIHLLVLHAFHGPCPTGFEGDHKDANRLNNKALNLQWLIKHENNPHTKLQTGEVWLIKKFLRAGIISQTYISKMFKIDPSVISDIKTEKIWKGV